MIPKVTVLMPVYNGEQYLKEAILSILNQTFSDFEFPFLMMAQLIKARK